MSPGPHHGDELPESVRQELIDAIEADKRLFPRRLLKGEGLLKDKGAFNYAQLHLNMENPTEAALWDYIVGRLREAAPWRYAQLDDFPDRFGYALRNADGRGLYIKLRFNDDFWVVLMSFHD